MPSYYWVKTRQGIFQDREEENIGKTRIGEGPHVKRRASLSVLSGLGVAMLLSIQRPSTLSTSRFRASRLHSFSEISAQIDLFYSVYEFHQHSCMCSTRVSGVHGGQKRVCNLLELELQSLSGHVGAGT